MKLSTLMYMYILNFQNLSFFKSFKKKKKTDEYTKVVLLEIKEVQKS